MDTYVELNGGDAVVDACDDFKDGHAFRLRFG